MDMNPANGSDIRYTSGDGAKLTSFTPILDGKQLHRSVSHVFSNGCNLRSRVAARLDKCRNIAEKALKEETNYDHAIEACDWFIHGHENEIGSELMVEFLCTRAALLLKRKWKDDVHMAIRDCHRARKINSSSVKALLCMSEALLQLGKHKDALGAALDAKSLAQSDPEVIKRVENIKQQIAAAETEKDNKGIDEEFKPKPRSSEEQLLRDILGISEGNNEASQDGPRCEASDDEKADIMDKWLLFYAALINSRN